jgi:hypothetical protein
MKSTLSLFTFSVFKVEPLIKEFQNILFHPDKKSWRWTEISKDRDADLAT